MKLLFSMLIASLMMSPMVSLHKLSVTDIDGKEVSLGQYKGKVLLIVNVASQCGNTPQYKELQQVYEKYKAKGFVVLGFPANNFMGQEPGTNAQIKAFCQKEYAVTFPMFSKISVKGKDIAPLYRFLTTKAENGVMDAEVRWNFQKFLISRQGYVLKSISPQSKVSEAEVISAIEDALAQ